MCCLWVKEGGRKEGKEKRRKEEKLDQQFQVKPEVLNWWIVGPFSKGHGCECGHEKRER